MSAESSVPVRQSRDRPGRGVIDKLRVHAWYTAVRAVSWSRLDYGLEERFAAETEGQTPRHGYICSGKWRRYRRGAMPSPSVVEAVEREEPGTRRWLEHPFWELIGSRSLGLEQLHLSMASLRPQVAKALFFQPQANCPSMHRKNGSLAQLEALGRMGDFDALTACLSIALEAELVDCND